MLQLEQFINFVQIKTYVDPKKILFSFAMNDVQIEQAYDALHIDLFNSIIQKSNNKNNDVANLQKYSITIIKTFPCSKR